MLSRVANSIYWMNRYVERAENVARFLGVNLELLPDLPPGVGEQWEPMVAVTGDLERFQESYDEADQANVVEFLGFDPDYPNSIRSCLRLARENARTVREAISSEMWEQINRLYLSVEDAARNDHGRSDPHRFCTEVKRGAHLFEGLTAGTMSHGEGWRFGRIGRMLERADKTSRMLDVKYFILLPETSGVGSALDNLQWASLLKSVSALEMYRKVFGRIEPADVADFLILDREFPRAIYYCLSAAEESLLELTGTTPGRFNNPAERRLGQLRSELDYAVISDIMDRGLHEYLDDLQIRLNEVDAGIFETFFQLRSPTAGAS
ncbi:MAG: alpha-E domain-containing protein [Phycisphaeraceae bacterium]|nr:alpha-E domain-containing protein [Phycisphaeraceae bacterium]